MALSPIFRDFCEELDHFHSHMFDHFPVDLHTDDFLKCPFSLFFSQPFCRRSCCDDPKGRPKRERTCCPRVSIGKDGFEMSMNVKSYKPEEIKVKTVDNMVQVEGQHKERNDKHGSVSRQFFRRYTLPRGYDPEQVVSTLSPDGILTVKAPAPANIPEIMEREVPIHQMAITRSQSK